MGTTGRSNIESKALNNAYSFPLNRERMIKWCAKNHIFSTYEVTLLHVYDFTPFSAAMYPGATMSVVQMNQRMHAAAKAKAMDLLNKHAKIVSDLTGLQPGNLKLALLQGKPRTKVKHAILEFINTNNPTIMICGSRGMGAMKRMLVGSVADFLMHNAKCTVMVVKDEEAETTRTPKKNPVVSPATTQQWVIKVNNDSQ